MPEMPYKNEPDLPRFTRENLTMSGLLISKDLKKFHRVGTLTTPDVDDRDVILFPEKINGKFWVLRRPNDWVGPKYGCEKASIWISSGDDLLMCEKPELLAQPQAAWENKKIGGSCPPLKTDKGWLVCYHGVDKEKNTYRTGFLMLDLKDPRKVIARTEDYVMEPEHDYETKGIVPFGVVFPTGNVVINGTLFVYYGAADMYIGVATAPLKEVVDFAILQILGRFDDGRLDLFGLLAGGEFRLRLAGLFQLLGLVSQSPLRFVQFGLELALRFLERLLLFFSHGSSLLYQCAFVLVGTVVGLHDGPVGVGRLRHQVETFDR
jgi:hypothetical protein